jgi:hypothetical protein
MSSFQLKAPGVKYFISAIVDLLEIIGAEPFGKATVSDTENRDSWQGGLRTKKAPARAGA